MTLKYSGTEKTISTLLTFGSSTEEDLMRYNQLSFETRLARDLAATDEAMSHAVANLVSSRPENSWNCQYCRV
jgi:hypothetical protein